MFRLIEKNVRCNGLFAGCNFWGWGGFARPVHEQWLPGDDYTGDPAQESQGLNSVFLTDTSTLMIIREEIEKFREINR